jgi:predicted nucleic acid-binding protein
MIVIDASVWMSSLLPDDVNHAVSNAWIRRWLLMGNTFIAPTLFLAELSGAITRRTNHAGLGRQAAASALVSQTIQFFALDLSLAEAAARHADSLRLRGGDAVYVALAARRNVPLVAWDKELLGRASNVILVQVPTL